MYIISKRRKRLRADQNWCSLQARSKLLSFGPSFHPILLSFFFIFCAKHRGGIQQASEYAIFFLKTLNMPVPGEQRAGYLIVREQCRTNSYECGPALPCPAAGLSFGLSVSFIFPACFHLHQRVCRYLPLSLSPTATPSHIHAPFPSFSRHPLRPCPSLPATPLRPPLFRLLAVSLR